MELMANLIDYKLNSSYILSPNLEFSKNYCCGIGSRGVGGRFGRHDALGRDS